MSYTNGSVALARKVRRQEGGARQPDGSAPGGATGNMSAHQRGAVRRSPAGRTLLPVAEIRRWMERLNPAGQRFVLGWISREAESNAELESLLSRALGNQWIEANGFEGGKGVAA